MSNISLDEINTKYFDVLKELGNIGAGNATTALAQLLSKKIDMNVPKVELLSFPLLASAICGEEESIVGIYLELEGQVDGSMMFLLDLESAHYLVNNLMGKDLEDKSDFTDMERSALMEIGNIIAGSYLSALSTLTKMKITTSVPYLSIDMAGAILSVPAIEFGQYGDQALLIETAFGDDVMVHGYFILLPELESYETILSSLGIVI